MNAKQKRWMHRILLALGIFALVLILDECGVLIRVLGTPGNVYAAFVLYLIPYLIAGYDVIARAWRNLIRGEAFDEALLMTIATFGAFALVLFPHTSPHMAEGAAVMLFYQVGELFQSYAVGKSRRSVAALMDIAPELARVECAEGYEEVDPEDVQVDDVFMVRPGERVPLDGIVLEGDSELDTSALTGESAPRSTHPGSEILSGCINLSGALRIRATKPYHQSTVARILELVESASERKAQTETFITRFARWYTPAVTIAALIIALLPPLVGAGSWSDWILRGLTFLVVSCPCALVISVPLSFFAGIGAASKQGILVKGSSFLEQLGLVDTVVFDKTGTLTNGTFEVVRVDVASGYTENEVIRLAAGAEAHSTHPLAESLKTYAPQDVTPGSVQDTHEQPGLGVRSVVEGKVVLVGNRKLLEAAHVKPHGEEPTTTHLLVAIEGHYAGCIELRDRIKPDAACAIRNLYAAGVSRCIMLTGDRLSAATAVAQQLGINELHAELLPQQKVETLESILSSAHGRVAFVGDGINDAPVLTRADVGIAMGAMGSDAAIEAADIVLMDDQPSKIPVAIRTARKTLRIVHENIVFALGVKFLILVLAALGFANMWIAVFGDVGVAVIAILNAMRAIHTSPLPATHQGYNRHQ